MHSHSSPSTPSWDTPLANLSLSNPHCNNDSCRAFYTAHQASQAQISWASQFDYGHCATWYYITVIAIFTVGHAWTKWRASPTASHCTKISHSIIGRARLKALAAWRFFAYRRLPGRLAQILGLPSLGLLLFLLTSVLYMAMLTFIQRPYYRAKRGYGSPPLAIRTGLMAIAMTPVIVALSGKANLITMLTGIGHERLNIIHRWTGFVTLGLAIVHTVPFFVAPLKDGGYAELKRRFYAPGAYEFTGVPPLGMLVGLVVLSVPWFRRHMHKLFYNVHVLLAITYLGLMFWHSGNIMDSWVYLWATIGLWVLSLFLRTFWFTQPTKFMTSHWFVGAPMVLKAMPQDMTKIEILAPEGFRWSPGQHCFLRIPGVSFLDNHPFSIASADSKDFTGTQEHEPSLSLFVRSHYGFTRRLADYMAKNPHAEHGAWLDGPYGGIHQKLEMRYDTVLLVAGGSGISACLPWLEHMAAKLRDKAVAPVAKTTLVRLVWAVRERDSIEWIAEELHRLELVRLKGRLQVVIHFTVPQRVERASTAETESENEIVGENFESKLSSQEKLVPLNARRTSMVEGIEIRDGRPKVKEVLEEVMQGGKTVVIGCGPERLKIDLANACAVAQKRVLKGEAEELTLCIETFGW